jgi:hypothetical protein
VLRQVALAINEPTTAATYADCAKEVGELFVSLHHEALERGIRLRLNASQDDARVSQPIRRADLPRAARLHLNEVLYRFAMMYGEVDPRNIFPDNIDRVRRLLGDSWEHGVELGVRLGYQEAQKEPGDEPRAASRESTRATPGERRHYPSRPFTERMTEYAEEWSERLKDIILDLETRGETPYLPQPLPPVEREELLAEMRSRLEPILTQFADAINQEETAPALARAQEDAYHLFGAVGANVADLALAMRLDAAAKAVSSGDSRPRRVRCKRISDIILPQRPGSQGGWVEKYRRMRAWEGSPQ